MPEAEATAETQDADRAAKPWLDMLADAERAEKNWQDRCDNIDKLYADLESLAQSRTDREFQIFWSNLEVLKPTVYARAPVPVVVPRFRDRRELPRRTADILERALVSDFEADDLHATLIHSRDDLVTNGRGLVWLRMGDRDGMEVPIAEHLDRKDFRHEPARKWQEVGWVAKRAWLTRDEATKRFGQLPLGMTFEKRELGGDDHGEKKAPVWELWHKTRRLVVWVSPGAEQVLDQREPWLDLTGFFPCPKPVYTTLKRGTLVPVPDFVYYRDQVEEINEITARIAALTEALRLRGFYPAGVPEVGEAIEAALKSTDDRAILVPVSSAASLAGGSLKDSLVWLPVKEVAEVIRHLIELRRQLIDDVYQITGLSDIMRGSTAASETATAQQLKAEFGSIRVRERQNEMVRLARDVTRLKAEAMAENMPIDALLQMSQVDDLPNQADLQQQAQQIAMAAQQQMQALLMEPDQEAAQQQAQQLQEQAQQQFEALGQQVTQEAVQALLRDQRTRPFVLDIETDSTIVPDENAEKERRTEFMTALGPLLQQGVMAMQAAPQLGQFVAESIRFVAAGFRAGRQMDDAIDRLAEEFENYQPMQQEGGEDPAAAEAAMQAEQVKAQAARALAEAKVQEAQARLQIEQQKAQQEAQAMQAELQIKAQEAELEQTKTGAEIRKIGADIQKIMAEIGRIKAQTTAARSTQ